MKPLISAEDYGDVYFDNVSIPQSVKETNEGVASQLNRVYDDSDYSYDNNFEGMMKSSAKDRRIIG
ncbi:15810_t:CDS:2 [Funneliformis mosseae]|uniref:15810_t:CDS:1 n=1 Tax=Funneliformis mosseae TaxID=27381 RepID=A0A9N8YRX9_FUNMO|nr:15810_t:CDS:2 [Funneliformis mosseae]